VKETATINGEIQTDKLIVQAGAVFNVKCQMGGQVISGFKSDTKKVAS
jgi:cytoskeletal protein CcmA (bactofilin family)